MKKYVIILPALLLLFSSCGNRRFRIDTSKDRYEVKIKRFDHDFLSIDPKNPKAGLMTLYKRYPDFLDLYTNQVIGLSSADTNQVAAVFSQFLQDKNYAQANAKARALYSDVSDIETKLSDAFTYIHHYFPGVKLPDIYLYVAGFNRPVMMNENSVAFGEDMYLGSDFAPYKQLTYNYLINNMKRDNLAPDIVSVVLFRMFNMSSSEGRLLDNIIYRGKVMYLMSVFMPDEKTENMIGYTPEQLKWCEKYEHEVWLSMVDKKHLFSTDVQLINKYVNDAPFTAPVSQESPGRLGTYMGYQIVKCYMKNNKEMTLDKLMDESNYQKILEMSGYKP